ncbi:hypothetical protein DWF00_24615 [Bosea caraganae]|uniref:Uncharacterized protein n=1 Tax=Bosea caraganae TaxID=2763117 RepID=A0A370L0S8_9HYPH|nr:hypothetical protein DWE98_23010 [Bosea caraganae]RDJ21552.1 hypothetical protein DWF00_24615 [Bosea caraganae]
MVEDDDLRAELPMIDENLCRVELSPAERAAQTGYPTSFAGGRPHSSVRGGPDIDSEADGERHHSRDDLKDEKVAHRLGPPKRLAPSPSFSR